MWRPLGQAPRPIPLRLPASHPRTSLPGRARRDAATPAAAGRPRDSDARRAAAPRPPPPGLPPDGVRRGGEGLFCWQSSPRGARPCGTWGGRPWQAAPVESLGDRAGRPSCRASESALVIRVCSRDPSRPNDSRAGERRPRHSLTQPFPGPPGPHPGPRRQDHPVPVESRCGGDGLPSCRASALGPGSARAPGETRPGPRAGRAAGCGAHSAALSARRLVGGPPVPVRAGFPAAWQTVGS